MKTLILFACFVFLFQISFAEGSASKAVDGQPVFFDNTATTAMPAHGPALRLSEEKLEQLLADMSNCCTGWGTATVWDEVGNVVASATRAFVVCGGNNYTENCQSASVIASLLAANELEDIFDNPAPDQP